MSEKLNALESMSAVMEEVRGLAKRERNSQQGFNFRGIDAVMNAVGPALRKVGAVIVPRILEIEQSRGQSKNGGTLTSTVVQVEYTWYGPDGSSIVGSAPGEAFDSGDKPLHVDTPILTTAGFKRMGELVEGDVVYDMAGKRTRVIGTTERKIAPSHVLEFANGERITAADDHEWYVRINGHRPLLVMTTAQIAAHKARTGRHPIAIPVAGPLDMDEASLPIDPWFLGYWLGDGASKSAVVTMSHDDEEHVRIMLSEAGYSVTSSKSSGGGALSLYVSNSANRRAETLPALLKGLQVWGDKHVPDIYLNASYGQRLALLRGLMDSDGCANNNKPMFVNTNPRLAEGVAILARSLGRRVSHWTQPYNGFGVAGVVHRVQFGPAGDNPFSFPRKAAGVRSLRKQHGWSIKSVTPVGEQPVRCITVDSASSSFLAGEQLIPTHNCTAKAMSVAYRTYLLQALTLPTDEPDPDAQVYDAPPRTDADHARADLQTLLAANRLAPSWADEKFKAATGEDLTTTQDAAAIRELTTTIQQKLQEKQS